jgi:hypothetical protein
MIWNAGGRTNTPNNDGIDDQQTRSEKGQYLVRRAGSRYANKLNYSNPRKNKPDDHKPRDSDSRRNKSYSLPRQRRSQGQREPKYEPVDGSLEE